MSILKCAAAFAALSVMAATTGHAADPIIGRWAADPSFCEAVGDSQAKSPLVVTDHSVRWFGDACRIGRTYRTGDTIHMEVFCRGESGERSTPVSLRKNGDRLEVTWGRATRGDLRRCP